MLSGELIDMAARAGVKFLQTQTNGLGHVEVDRIRDAGMMLAHCPGELSSVALAEIAMMFMLNLAQLYGEASRTFAAGRCYFPAGREFNGRSLGIVDHALPAHRGSACYVILSAGRR